MTYITLFFTAFIAATLFPMGSEALLAFDIQQGFNIILLLLFATLGNTLGSCVNYYFGLKGEEFLERKKLLKKEKIAKYEKFFKKYGGWSLLFSWMPIVGDPLTFLAGIFRFKFFYFLLIVSFAKFSRYAFIAFVTVKAIS